MGRHESIRLAAQPDDSSTQIRDGSDNGQSTVEMKVVDAEYPGDSQLGVHGMAGQDWTMRLDSKMRLAVSRIRPTPPSDDPERRYFCSRTYRAIGASSNGPLIGTFG